MSENHTGNQTIQLLAVHPHLGLLLYSVKENVFSNIILAAPMMFPPDRYLDSFFVLNSQKAYVLSSHPFVAGQDTENCSTCCARG